MLRLSNKFLLKNHTQFRSVDRAILMKFLSCGVCVFYKMGPQRRCRRYHHQCPHRRRRSRVAAAITVTCGSLSPLPSLMGCRCLWVTIACGSPSLMFPLLVGHHRSWVAVAITVRLPLPSPSLTGCHRLRVDVAHRSSSLVGHCRSRVTR